MNSQVAPSILRTLMCLVILPFLIGCEQARVDALMEELCQKDGGMKIYEKVVLPADQFTNYGDPIFHRSWNKPGGGYQFIFISEKVKVDKPTLTRYRFSVVRQDDKKLLGEYIVYIRIGGGLMWRPGPDPSKSCPTDTNENTFLKSIFIQGE